MLRYWNSVNQQCQHDDDDDDDEDDDEWTSVACQKTSHSMCSLRGGRGGVVLID